MFYELVSSCGVCRRSRCIRLILVVGVRIGSGAVDYQKTPPGHISAENDISYCLSGAYVVCTDEGKKETRLKPDGNSGHMPRHLRYPLCPKLYYIRLVGDTKPWRSFTYYLRSTHFLQLIHLETIIYH